MRYYRVWRRARQRSDQGQGITEYAAIIAFVCLLIALTISFAQGTLGPAISAAFSVVVSQLNSMAKAGSSGS